MINQIHTLIPKLEFHYMSSSYNFIDHTADIAVAVTADSIEELFSASANAFKESVIEEDLKKDDGNILIQLNSPSPEVLLVNFLSELNFRLISRKKIFGKISHLKIYKNDNNWNLECTLQEYDVDEDKIKTEIKAVTYHQMEIKEENRKYFTRIVFDI